MAHGFLGTQALAAEPQNRFASIYKISGVVAVVDAASGSRRELKPGDIVRVGDVIQASATGEAVLRMDDAGIIAIRPNTSFVMERFSAKSRPDDQFGMRIFTGALRLITGWTGLRNKDNYRVVTPTATIGIRGTDHEPYVMSAELAASLKQAEGTYNKVNRGGTTLDVAGAQLTIDAGQVGFAPSKSGPKKRALMTALLPSLLDKVPGFYVPGLFDAELEALAAHDLAAALKTLAPGEPPAPTLPAKPTVDAPAPSPDVAGTVPKPANPNQCDPAAIARTWLEQLDGAIVERQALRFVNLFAPQVRVKALVRNTSGDTTELSYSRSELAKSTFASLDQLTQFATRRPSVNAQLASGSAPGKCDRIEVDSVVIESGTRAGMSYRLESLETYTLVRLGDNWLAVSASTKQR
ncbi:MAG: hypothetical protein V4713_18495 [Pseudomonadota bacterium]